MSRWIQRWEDEASSADLDFILILDLVGGVQICVRNAKAVPQGAEAQLLELSLMSDLKVRPTVRTQTPPPPPGVLEKIIEQQKKKKD